MDEELYQLQETLILRTERHISQDISELRCLCKRRPGKYGGQPEDHGSQATILGRLMEPVSS
jgi:hypothetical protein